MQTITIRGTDRKALVDDEDYPVLNRMDWRYQPTTGYCVHTVMTKQVPMHRFILGNKAHRGRMVAYVDGDKFNNQKSNLQVWRYSDYAKATQRGRKKTSEYVGVFYHKAMHKWCTKPRYNNQNLGTWYFDSEIAAALKYCAVMAEAGAPSATPEDLIRQKRVYTPL